jgi:hypothetical protein
LEKVPALEEEIPAFEDVPSEVEILASLQILALGIFHERRHQRDVHLFLGMVCGLLHLISLPACSMALCVDLAQEQQEQLLLVISVMARWHDLTVSMMARWHHLIF